MTKPILLLLAIASGFYAAEMTLGFWLAYRIGYGVFAILAAIIAMTFLWLWFKRSTPLALGMAFGWAGAASVIAWWWVRDVFDRPDWMEESALLFVFLSLYLVGAIMHLEVIGRSFSLSRLATFAPVVVAFLMSVAIALGV